MRRRPLAAVLAAAALVTAAGCGGQPERPREPLGQGETQVPEPTVRQVEGLRSVKVEIRDGRFEPGGVSVRVDNAVKIHNADDRAYEVKSVEGGGTGGPAAQTDEPLAPGETIERSFTRPGTTVLETEDGDRLTVQVYQ